MVSTRLGGRSSVEEPKLHAGTCWARFHWDFGDLPSFLVTPTFGLEIWLLDRNSNLFTEKSPQNHVSGVLQQMALESHPPQNFDRCFLRDDGLQKAYGELSFPGNCFQRIGDKDCTSLLESNSSAIQKWALSATGCKYRCRSEVPSKFSKRCSASMVVLAYVFGVSIPARIKQWSIKKCWSHGAALFRGKCVNGRLIFIHLYTSSAERCRPFIQFSASGV